MAGSEYIIIHTIIKIILYINIYNGMRNRWTGS